MNLSHGYKIIIINSGISLIAILLSSFLTYQFTRNQEAENRIYYSNVESLKLVIKNTLKYANYSIVNWVEIENKYYRPYNCDWAEYNYFQQAGIDELMKQNNFPSGVACIYYNRLQNAKTDFRLATTEARIMGSENISKAIINIENGFDEVFVKITSDSYYLRSFVDNYNEIMEVKFDTLEKAIQHEIRK